MAIPIIMPRQGQSVESCIIAKWFKKKGDTVNIGDILFSYETDKAAFDEEAQVSGTLLEIFAEEGEDVPVLTNVCVIGNPNESISEFNPSIEKSISQAEVNEINASKVSEKSVVNSEITAIESSSEEGLIKISPRARNLAEKTGVDYRGAEGSGPHGRIIEKDIIELKEKGVVITSAARDFIKDENILGTGIGGRITTSNINRLSNAPTKAESSSRTKDIIERPEYEEVKISNMRKVIAKAMQYSLSSTAQLTLNSSFDATDVMTLRIKLKESKERLGLGNITLNDIIAYAVSRTLSKHRELNAHLQDDKMLYFKNVHLGIAIDTERGLMVPTVFNANLKSLNEISAEIKYLAKECQKGTINPDLLKGGTFTITNLGTLDVESFTPVINPPQTGILGVNNIIQKAKEVKGVYEFYPAMGLSLTFDHRALDGAPAAKFLKDLKVNLESFSTLLVL